MEDEGCQQSVARTSGAISGVVMAKGASNFSSEKGHGVGSSHSGSEGDGELCQVGSLRKGPWSPWEDELLLQYVRKHGQGNWKEVARRSGLRRCGKSCRLRWTNQLRPNLRKDRFTPSEEATILLLHSIYGNKWAKISAQVPGRTDNSIKNFMNMRAKRQKRQSAASSVQPRRTSTSLPISSALELDAASASSSSSSNSRPSSRVHPTVLTRHVSLAHNAASNIHEIRNAAVQQWPLGYLRHSTDTEKNSLPLRLNAQGYTKAIPIQRSPVLEDVNVSNCTLDDGRAHHANATAANRLIDPRLLDERLWIMNVGTQQNMLATDSASVRYGHQRLFHNSSASRLSQQKQGDQLAGSPVLHRRQQGAEIPLAIQIAASELPSVQTPSSNTRVVDPFSLLGGQSVRLIDDRQQLAVYEERSFMENQRSEAEDDLIKSTSAMESTLTSNYSDYTLECIVKPLTRN